MNQCVRLDIFNDTKNLREIIIGRALYGTCIDLKDYDKINSTDSIDFFNDDRISIKECKDYKEDTYNIASDWFDNLNKED